MQLSFQKTGIDAVAYFENDLLTAGRDVSMAMAQYLLDREVSILVLVQKKNDIYKVFVTEFNKKANFVDQNQPAWLAEGQVLNDLLLKLYRTSASGLKKTNYLINDVPETGLSINPINGRRGDFFAIDLRIDLLAVPKFGNAEMDKELEEIIKTYYPFKYALTDPGMTEADTRKQGYASVLRFIHARDKIAKGMLGYDMTKSESAIVSITYPENEPRLKNIPANTEVFKFYFKHIESGDVFLGTKWDADLTWQQALINQLKAMKSEMKIN